MAMGFEEHRVWDNALHEGDMPAIEAKIKEGLSQADLDQALLKVAYRGKEPALKALLQAGANPNAVDGQGRNALLMAISGPSVKCVKALAPLTDLSHRTPGGHTALMMAAKSKSSAALALLLTPERAKEADKEGWTPFFYASYYDSEANLALLAPLSDPVARDHFGKTALMVAAERNSMTTLQALLPLCDPRLVDRDGKDAAALAKSIGSLKAARFLTAYARVMGEREALASHAIVSEAASPRAKPSL